MNIFCRPLRHCALAIALLCGLSVSAHAIVVDSYATDPGSFENYGNPAAGTAAFISGTSATGFVRQVRGRDGHSGTVSNPTAARVTGIGNNYPPTPDGVLEFWGGATAPEYQVAYGSAIIPGGGGVNPSDLNLNYLLTDTFEMDVPYNHGVAIADPNLGTFTIRLHTGTDGGGSGGTHDYGSAPYQGTLSIALSSFAGMTAQDAADIDGITIYTTPSYTGQPTAAGAGIQIGEIRIGSPVPEPSSIVLAGLGLVGLGWFGVRRRNR